MRDPRVGLLFLVPGVDETLRVNGRAALTADPALRERFAVDGRAPRTVMVVAIETVYFQCARALVRSALWDPARRVARESLPSVGTMLHEASGGAQGGEAYDRDWLARIQATLY